MCRKILARFPAGEPKRVYKPIVTLTPSDLENDVVEDDFFLGSERCRQEVVVPLVQDDKKKERNCVVSRQENRLKLARRDPQPSKERVCMYECVLRSFLRFVVVGRANGPIG